MEEGGRLREGVKDKELMTDRVNELRRWRRREIRVGRSFERLADVIKGPHLRDPGRPNNLDPSQTDSASLEGV
jgi:hypothetical protein